MPINFTFVDDVITIPYKTVTSSDALTLSDNVLSLLLDSILDSGSFAESLSLISAAINNSDSSSLNDIVLNLSLVGNDSSSLSDDSDNIDIYNQDAISFSEEVSNSLLSLDSGAVFESLELSIGSIVDSGALSEFINNILIDNVIESILETENVFVYTDLSALDSDGFLLESNTFNVADIPSVDTSTGTEIPSISADLPNNDSTSVSESAPTINLSVIEESTLSESIEISLDSNDLSNFSDSANISVSNQSVDSVSSIETSSFVDVNANTNDSSLLSEANLIEANNLGAEQAELSEFVSIEVYVVENIILSEVVTNSLNSSDESEFIDQVSIGAIASDISILDDLSGIGASISNTDSGGLIENNYEIRLDAEDNSNLFEIPFYASNASALDLISLISETGDATVLKEDIDTFTVTDFISPIGINGLQLITFSERIGIGTAAPLVIDINDTPTVHGSVTGDIISLSIGGTEPVLL